MFDGQKTIKRAPASTYQALYHVLSPVGASKMMYFIQNARKINLGSFIAYTSLLYLPYHSEFYRAGTVNSANNRNQETNMSSCSCVNNHKSCCIVDVCRWEDLAVGAPQFFVKDSLVGGAVYVYINNGGKNWEKIVPTQLLGPKESMFGLAVENIGDANQDGYGGLRCFKDGHLNVKWAAA